MYIYNDCILRVCGRLSEAPFSLSNQTAPCLVLSNQRAGVLETHKRSGYGFNNQLQFVSNHKSLPLW